MPACDDRPIRFTEGTCALGALLLATSDQGLAAIALGDDADTLRNALHLRFPLALHTADAPLTSYLAELVASIETPTQAPDLPLDMRGTPFQLRVWQALREIPVGTTLSYQDLARRLGNPLSFRAVAGACAANPLAVVIPCHRVLRRDGGLGGYRWGVARKRALLDREAALSPAAR